MLRTSQLQGLTWSFLEEVYDENDKEVDEANKLKEVVEKEVGGLKGRRC